MNNSTNHRKSYIFVIIFLATIGYFVNIFLIISFAMNGSTTLESLISGKRDAYYKETVSSMLSVQMIGAFVGSILWGVIGDKQGRMNALFASTLLCAFASFLTCFLGDLPTDKVVLAYYILIFLIGVGLSGELGADMTLVSEVLHTDERDSENGFLDKRMLGTTFLVVAGALGGLLASVVTVSDWKNTYYWGAGLSLLLMFLRISVYGSNLFRQLKYDKPTVVRGNLRYLFSDKTMLRKFMVCCGIGLPIWFVLGILLKKPIYFGYTTLSTDVTDPKITYFWGYLGLAIGSLVSGIWAYYVKSFKKPLIIFQIIGFVSILFYLLDIKNTDANLFRFKCLFLGFGRGDWCLFVSIIPTYFGTNLRCTATTIAINTVRGLLFAFTFLMFLMTTKTDYWGWEPKIAGLLLGFVLVGIGLLVSVRYLEETYNRNLDFED
jgi:MFS transporter, putative metabolite:H+ symporter